MCSFTAVVIIFYSSSTVKTIRLSQACRLIRQMHGGNFSTTCETLGKQLAFVTEKPVSSTSVPACLPSPPMSLRHSLSRPLQGVVLGQMVMLRSPRHPQPPAPGPLSSAGCSPVKQSRMRHLHFGASRLMPRLLQQPRYETGTLFSKCFKFYKLTSIIRGTVS